ncbi:hypothetical protein OC834_004914 [Tilletia horrida]|nr:hypothetical protein OC834_004914 [Tilletia horrida]
MAALASAAAATRAVAGAGRRAAGAGAGAAGGAGAGAGLLGGARQLARLPPPSSTLTAARCLSTSAAAAAAAAAVSSSASAAQWQRRSALPSNTLLLAGARHLAARHRPTITPTAVLVGSTRSLSLWPFSRSPKPDAAANAEHAAQQVQDQAQQAAHDAREAIAATASDAQHAVANTSAADLSHKATEVAHNVQDGIVNSSEAVAQLVSTVAAGGELPHTPTFTELGLGSSWWPPTGWIQTFLDYMTTTTGLPWWATIIGSTIVLRFALAPLLIYVQGNTIRLSNIQPKLTTIMSDIQHAKATGDMALVQSSAQKAQALFRENDCHPLRSFLLPAVQMPIFISFFFALRGMATAGLPSLKDGGLGWFVDLTAADPYYILPITSAALTLAVLETGAETGTNQAMATPQMKTMKNFLRGFLVIATFFILDFPAAVLLYWCTNNTFSLLQLLALRTRFLRARLNLPERLPHAATASKPVTLSAGAGGYRAAPVQAQQDVGFWQGIKQGMDSVKGMDAHTRSQAPGVLSRRGGAVADESTTSLARDRALKAMYAQSGAAAASSAASTAASTVASNTEIAQGELGKGAAVEERAARIQSARQRRAARRRI